MRRTIGILSYANGDFLVSGLVVLTSGTSVRTFSFIHFSHYVLRIFGAFGLSSSAYVELIVPVFSTKRIFLRDTFSRSDPLNKLGRTFHSIFSGSFLPYGRLVFFRTSAGITFRRGDRCRAISSRLYLVFLFSVTIIFYCYL